MSKKPTTDESWVDDATALRLIKLRQELLTGPDNVLFLNVGHFLTWYAACEMALTMLLYWAVNNHPAKAKFDAAMFDVLTKGMDAKVKVTRLKAAIAQRGLKLPEPLKQRLAQLQDKESNVRNFIVHSYLHWDSAGDRLDAFRSHNFVPTKQRRLGQKFEFTPKPVFSIGGFELFLHALWLKGFAEDLGEMAGEAATTDEKALQPARYRSWVPPRGPQNLKQKAPPTKPRKPARKQPAAQSRKTASPRASKKKDAG